MKCVSQEPEYVLLVLGVNVIFNQSLFYNLQRWQPIRERVALIAAIHNPYITELACDVKRNARITGPGELKHCAAVLLHREAAEHAFRLSARWLEIPELLAGVARKLKAPVYFHAPSLAKPRLQQSKKCWPTVDFDRHWRAN